MALYSVSTKRACNRWPQRSSSYVSTVYSVNPPNGLIPPHMPFGNMPAHVHLSTLRISSASVCVSPCPSLCPHRVCLAGLRRRPPPSRHDPSPNTPLHRVYSSDSLSTFHPSSSFLVCWCFEPRSSLLVCLSQPTIHPPPIRLSHS